MPTFRHTRGVTGQTVNYFCPVLKGAQFHIENVFKDMKDRDIGSWWPLYHWTDQKINVHSFSCTIAVLLRALAHRRVKEAGIDISMKRL